MVGDTLEFKDGQVGYTNTLKAETSIYSALGEGLRTYPPGCGTPGAPVPNGQLEGKHSGVKQVEKCDDTSGWKLLSTIDPLQVPCPTCHLLPPNNHRLHQSGRHKRKRQFSSNNGYQVQCVPGISARSRPAPQCSWGLQDLGGCRASLRAPGAPAARAWCQDSDQLPRAATTVSSSRGDYSSRQAPRRPRAPAPRAPLPPRPRASGRDGAEGGTEEGAPAAGGILRDAWSLAGAWSGTQTLAGAEFLTTGGARLCK